MKILVINAGSSSVKYQLFDMTDERVLAKGICERIAIPGGKFKHKVPGRPDYEADIEMKNHREALELIVKTLTDKDLGVISSMSEIAAVGHRVLHGGEKILRLGPRERRCYKRYNRMQRTRAASQPA